MRVMVLFGLTLFIASQGAESQLKESLDQWDPPWYNQQEESWQRIVPILIENEHIDKRDSSSPQASQSDQTDERNQELFSLNIDGFSDALFTILMIVGIIAVVIVLVFLVYSFIKNMDEITIVATDNKTSSKKVSSFTQDRLPALLDLQDTDLEVGLQLAQTRHDWRLVVIYAYALGLIAADHKHLIYLHPSSTNRQYMHEISTHGTPQHLKWFAPLLRRFEEVYFGGRQAQAALAQAQLQDLQSFQTLTQGEKETRQE